MTVRFKSEYQKSYGVSRSRSVSPQRCAPLAGLRSDHMGISREPGLQRRRRPGPLGAARSCSSLLFPPDVQQQSVADPVVQARRKAPSAASRSRSAHRNEPPLDPKRPTPPSAPANYGAPLGPETPAGPRPAADPGSSVRPVADGISGNHIAPREVRARPSQPDSQPQPSTPDDQHQPSTLKVDNALRQRAGLRPGGHMSGGHRSEYHKQFGWKKPVTTASPLLTAKRVLYSSNGSVPPFKTNPYSMETEYRQSFQGLNPPTRPRLRKHLEHQRVPLFHIQTTNRKRREESQKQPRPHLDDGSLSPLKGSAAAAQVHRGLRNLDEGRANGTLQVKELRQKALTYRRRAWGTNFSRVHLGQLLSDHNTLWEPTNTTDSHTGPSTPRLTSDLSPEQNSRCASCVEALDLASNSSKRSSVAGSGETSHTHKKTERKAQTPPGPPAERSTAWGEEDEEDDNTDDEEGRLPTPRLKTKPVQRTHHDLTTPATGGAILVGNLRSADDPSPNKPQTGGSAVSTETGSQSTPVNMLTKPKEAWSENIPASTNHSPDHKPISSPPSKPIRTKHSSPSPAAPPPPVPPPQHGIQGTLRHPDFQHNGELGLRFREPPCSGGCGSDEDDRLSVMSWRSAASCSAASAVLERAQKRRQNFWGKRR
ncbi:nuclear protein MDM1 isoform 2-T2 [Odontesthes bonariensis]|uniref:nuclear protein MDM1 isoform X2 n=1 Tax=Odontesthes bonariensis TaxID=219752 RepID=UPI003F5809C1